MSYMSTTNLNLRKDGGDEKIVDMRPHLNTNLDIIDQAYGELDSRCRGQQTWGNLKSTATWGELKGNGVTTPSSQTTNLELVKPGYDSNVDVEVFNDNMDAIDSAIGPLPANKTLQGQISTLQHSVNNQVVSSYGNMHGYLSTFSGPDHLFGIGCTIINNNNAAYKGHIMSLVVTKTGLNLFDHNTQSWVWSDH